MLAPNCEQPEYNQEETLEPESKFVEANGLNFHYLAWGDPQKPPLVMAHAIGLCAQIWNHAARDLAKD